MPQNTLLFPARRFCSDLAIVYHRNVCHYTLFQNNDAPLRGCWKYLLSQRVPMSVCGKARSESIPPGGSERARTSEEDVVMCGSSAAWPLVRSRSIPPEHPSPSSRQTAASKWNGAKRFLAVAAMADGRERRCPGEPGRALPTQLCPTGGPAI